MSKKDIAKDSANATVMNRKNAERATKRLLHYYADSSSVDRKAAGECRYCYYLGRGVVGQAFTDANCVECGAGMRFPTTRTNKYCECCGTTYGICRHCGAEID